MSESVSHFD